MSKHLVKTGPASTALQDAAPGALEPLRAPRGGAGFFSFTYAVTELSLDGDRTRVRARQTRLEDGRLTTETFEGELDRSAFTDAMHEAQAQLQQQLQAQLAWMQRALTWWLPRQSGRDTQGD